jgi:hypothetical protein
VITITKNWRRYRGPRSELVRATKLAVDVLGASNRVDSTVEVELDDRRGRSEQASTVDAITARHSAELADLETIAITVSTDPRTWLDEHFDPASEERKPDPPLGPVRIRVSQYGTSGSITGEDRTTVEGLSGKLAEAVGRAATNSPGFPREFLRS